MKPCAGRVNHPPRVGARWWPAHGRGYGRQGQRNRQRACCSQRFAHLGCDRLLALGRAQIIGVAHEKWDVEHQSQPARRMTDYRPGYPYSLRGSIELHRCILVSAMRQRLRSRLCMKLTQRLLPIYHSGLREKPRRDSGSRDVLDGLYLASARYGA